jgi:hypothetical protein
MKNENIKSLPSKRTPDQLAYLIYLRKEVERVTELSLYELKEQYTDDHLFILALKHLTTTKTAICEALHLREPNQCRNKRKLEVSGALVQSTEKVICSCTGYAAHNLTTNPAKFEELRKTNQLNLF